MYMANPPYDEDLLKHMYEVVKKSLLSSESICFIMSIPQWEDYDLENKIETENIYKLKKIKHEKFHNPFDKMKMITIPPYISYLFWNDAFFREKENDIIVIKKIFMEFENIKK